MENAVALSSLAILASVVAGLVWLLKKLFTQNDTTIRELTKVLAKLQSSIDKDDADRREFQACMISSMQQVTNNLAKVSDTQDVIHDRQVAMYDVINSKVMNVETLNVSKKAK